MNRQKIGLAVLGTSALCVAALSPVRLGDGRMHFWPFVLRNAQIAAHHAMGEIDHLLGHRAASPPSVADATREAPDQPSPAAPEKTAPETAEQKQATIALADDRIRALGYDATGIEDALAAYRVDNLAQGDAIAARIADPVVRAALEWVALRDVSQKISLERLSAFASAHPGWPAPDWLRHQTEAKLFRVNDPHAVEAYFAKSPPVTAIGKYALARALKADGETANAAQLVRSIFRDSDLSGFLESRIKADFGGDIAKADYKYRADRLLYKEQVGPALHFAALAGPDVLALAKARAAVIQEAPSDKAIAAVPDALRKDPGLLLAELQKLRRSDKIVEAATLMQSAPRDRATLIDGDEWWTERRLLARKLLDAGYVNAAYVVCATHSAVSNEAFIEAEFHAGWIALRFMNDPSRAAYHFAQASTRAETPTSMARVAYWQGRAAEATAAAGALADAQQFYRKAAGFASTYYGQLAREKLGEGTDLVREPTHEAIGTERDVAIRVVELLYAAGDRDAAFALASDAASTVKDEGQVAALATVIENQGDAHLALTIGKLIGHHGIAVDNLAFPTFGIPHYETLQNSAAPSVVYAIARQESAFLPAVVSKAGAKGLMQMIDSTARHTATKAGVPFDPNRMLSDPSFNAQLGAAHLGMLLAEQGGSYILTFAAYNAGGGRVKQWIEAYGDPRKPGVDPIDWVERIPFTETRNYVQRVMANVAMYQAIFADKAKGVAGARGTDDREAKL